MDNNIKTYTLGAKVSKKMYMDSDWTDFFFAFNLTFC
jgi:hypothetical protein